MSNSEKFNELLDKWITVEEGTIGVTNELLTKTKNPVLQTLIGLMKSDSEKHKRILETIKLHLTTVYTFTTDDMKVINEFINKHEDIERGAIELAEQTLVSTSLPMPKLLLRYLLEDEKKHDLLIHELGEVKKDMATQ